MLAGAALWGQQKQTRRRHRAQDPGPETQHRIIDFAEVVQAAEGEEAVRLGGQRVDGEITAIQGIVAPETVGQPHGLLGVERLIRAQWIEVGIAEPVIDRVQTGAAGVAGEGHLHGSRFASEDQQAIVGGVHGEVDEDVDLVLADLGGELLVAEADNVAPVLRAGAEALREGVGTGDLGIAEDFKIARIMPGMERPHVEADDMRAEVGQRRG